MALPDFFKSEKPCIFSENTGETVILGPVTSESESGTVQVTDNAVEDGTVISDHIRKDPETVEISTFLSDKNDLLGQAVDAAKSALGISIDTLKVKEKIEILKRFRDEGEIVTYTGPVFSGQLTDGYDIIAKSMLITSIPILRSAETGSGLDVKISLKKILIAQAMLAEINLPTEAKKTTNKGQSNTKTETVKTKNTSILKGIFG